MRRAEMAGFRSALVAAAQLWPEIGVDSINVAGGFVPFMGRESPLSQAVGVGFDRPVTDGDIATITDFYQSRGAPARTYASPLSDPTLVAGLAKAGYAPVEYQNVFAVDDLAANGRRDDRVVVARDLVAWARASASGFADGVELKPGDADVGLLIASSDGVIALEIRERGTIVATGAMDVRGEVAALFAASTLPSARRRGLHQALIMDRLARAHEAGATFARAMATPGSVSEHNFQRCGFETLYTRALWERKARA
jgi:GNAT superfamily N-acetyltransferase